MLFCWLAIIAFFAQAATGAAFVPTVSVQNIEGWTQTASGKRQITHDGGSKRLPTLSPSGSEIAYVVDKDVPNNAPEEEIVILDLKGETLQRVIPEGYVPREFERLDWLDAGRIGAMTCGHANCMYWVLNPQSGKTIQVMSGGFEFTWSHNRQFVARWGVSYGCDDPREEGTGVPCMKEHDSVSFNQDDITMYPPEWVGKNSDRSHSHDIGIRTPVFVWSPDDKWVAFTDLIGPEEDWYVVILSPDGKVLRDTVPIDPDYKAMIEWLDDRHLDLRTGKRVFHFAVQGNQFGEIRERP